MAGSPASEHLGVSGAALNVDSQDSHTLHTCQSGLWDQDLRIYVVK
jgi:predicted histidine transporter YuiF (NhaC family)